ncbi:uncharacterized protein A1O5_02968 [Cladophialophora psammophila CBS 110553]|uniref:DUF7908 domain-containing protein n=1 Tax=Cladophialophora psammophila CBS 110553 TaxID=1182543 RepID=W9WZ20_9EURO|nr:uncharacterized protein A1O5_02968 [Cladophialophora psammophila CBS 110553]EXJ73208.1 hypothetical protein A1O5_02968 [Cladophialophora psammophila CBS 110553]
MNSRILIGIAFALRLFVSVSCYGTTISVGISYCPATYTSSSTSSGSSTTPTIIPGEPVYLTFALGGFTEYLTGNGMITNDAQQAAPFAVTPFGQLMSAGNYVSTSGDVSSQPFAASPETPVMKRLPRIFTLFSISENDMLVWKNDAFVGGQAIFCVSGSTLVIVFNGVLPQGCISVQIGVIPTGNVNPSSTSSATALSQSSTITTSAMSTSMQPPPSSSVSTSGTVDSMSTTASFSESSVSTSGTSMSSPSPTDITSSSYMPESSSSPVLSSTTLSAYPAPTTTGTPNCYDRSPFDGTVNNDYLILCDTDLPGFDLDVVPATDIAECIDACSSHVPGSQGPCVAVEFDILANTNPCHLKFDIGTVNRGANSFAQAAIVVNRPYSPNIVFSDTGVSSSQTSETKSSTFVSGISTTTNVVSTLTASSSIPSVGPNTSTYVSPTSSMQQNPPSTTPSSSPSSMSSTAAGTSSQASPSSGPTSSSGPNSASTGQQQSSTMTTLRSSLSSSSSLTPVGSSPGPRSPTSSLMSVSGSSVSTAQPASSGPATASQPTSQSSLSLRSTLLVTSSRSPIASTTVPLTSTTAASYCSATPTTTSLCSTYNHQALNVNSDGYCYEVECATSLQGTVLTGNSTTATSLKNCVGYCTNYNVALPFGCIGVSYLGSSSGSGPNCLLLSSVTGTVSDANVDSARLLYGGYPSITDPIFTLTSTTTPFPVSSLSSPFATASSITTSTTSYVPTSCAAAPTGSASACPGNSPTCYSYNFLGNNADFEIECATAFTGSMSQPLLTFDLTDCINQCQYANALRVNSCLGVTFMVTDVSQGSINNCFPYSTLTCATRGNATFNSARMLYAGYPQMTDYNDPSFVCAGSGGTTATTAPTSSSSARASTTTSVTQAATTASTSSTTDLSQATSTNFPLAYPQDPVCNSNLMSTYEGRRKIRAFRPSVGD